MPTSATNTSNETSNIAQGGQRRRFATVTCANILDGNDDEPPPLLSPATKRSRKKIVELEAMKVIALENSSRKHNYNAVAEIVKNAEQIFTLITYRMIYTKSCYRRASSVVNKFRPSLQCHLLNLLLLRY